MCRPTGWIELLDLVGLADAADRRVGGYSLGMRQRLGIAQTLVGDPQVLILDEPANGLDPEGIAWMRGLLRDFADRGGTVLLSSHLLHEVQATVDHLVVISQGAVVASGPMAELLASSSLLLRTPDPEALAACAPRRPASTTNRGPDQTFTVDIRDGRVTTEMVARVALEQQVLLTELRHVRLGRPRAALLLTHRRERGPTRRRQQHDQHHDDSTRRAPPTQHRRTSTFAGIPFSRLLRVEWGKATDTRAARWLLAAGRGVDGRAGAGADRSPPRASTRPTPATSASRPSA